MGTLARIGVSGVMSGVPGQPQEGGLEPRGWVGGRPSSRRAPVVKALKRLMFAIDASAKGFMYKVYKEFMQPQLGRLSG